MPSDLVLASTHAQATGYLNPLRGSGLLATDQAACDVRDLYAFHVKILKLSSLGVSPLKRPDDTSPETLAGGWLVFTKQQRLPVRCTLGDICDQFRFGNTSEDRYLRTIQRQECFILRKWTLGASAAL